MRQEGYETRTGRPLYRPGPTITTEQVCEDIRHLETLQVPSELPQRGTGRQPIIKAEMEHATNLIAEGINEARSLVERLIPILGASSTTKETVEPPKDNSQVPPMVHAIREQIEGLRELVAIIKDAASRVEV